MKTDTWFNLPGYASHFIPKEGEAKDEPLKLLSFKTPTFKLLKKYILYMVY